MNQPQYRTLPPDRCHVLETLSLLNETSQDDYFLWDFSCGQIFFGAMFFERFRFPDRTGNTCTIEEWLRLVYEKDRPALFAALDDIRQGRSRIFRQEYRLKDASGAVIWVQCSAACRNGADGKPESMLGQLSDTTAQHQCPPQDTGFERQIMSDNHLGLWVIHMNPQTGEKKMYANETMLQLLGLSGNPSPEECYHHWYSRINDGYYHYVNLSVENMIESRRIVQLEYTWNHPVNGETMVRCTGTRIADCDGCICLSGYHRNISDIDKPRFLPDTAASEMFEFNSQKHSIYFHTDRKFISGSDLKENDFPQCWIDSELVHPHFAEEFRSLFVPSKKKEELYGQEMLLKAKSGAYEWFKIKTRRLSSAKPDSHTIVVLLDPANQERALQLEYMRKVDFYESMLSETIAYAEVDVESGHLKTSGGLWGDYADQSRRQDESFNQIIGRSIRQFVLPEYVEDCLQLLDTRQMRAMCQSGRHIRSMSLLRHIYGEIRWVQLVCHVFQDRFSENMYALLYLKDIDMQKKQELAHELAAAQDPLTSAYNRRSFEHEVTKFMLDPNSSRCGALIMLDLDNFKAINDAYGHLAGDSVLKEMTRLLLSTFRSRDIIGRLGGDEFVVFVKDIQNPDVLNRRMDSLLFDLSQYKELPVSCSAGITFLHDGPFSYEECLQQADTALYHSKKQGKNTYRYFEHS
ncbi:MAG: diguanylate cyclase [Lachnospiraceae bacterium]|nr:diguanylate cyclase [Lachnospiraceae bacterium]